MVNPQPNLIVPRTSTAAPVQVATGTILFGPGYRLHQEIQVAGVADLDLVIGQFHINAILEVSPRKIRFQVQFQRPGSRRRDRLSEPNRGNGWWTKTKVVHAMPHIAVAEGNSQRGLAQFSFVPGVRKVRLDIGYVHGKRRVTRGARFLVPDFERPCAVCPPKPKASANHLAVMECVGNLSTGITLVRALLRGVIAKGSKILIRNPTNHTHRMAAVC